MFDEELYEEEEELEEENEVGESGFVCDDCDYRWEEATREELDTGFVVCPMCGSTNVTQL